MFRIQPVVVLAISALVSALGTGTVPVMDNADGIGIIRLLNLMISEAHDPTSHTARSSHGIGAKSVQYFITPSSHSPECNCCDS